MHEEGQKELHVSMRQKLNVKTLIFCHRTQIINQIQKQNDKKWRKIMMVGLHSLILVFSAIFSQFSQFILCPALEQQQLMEVLCLR